MNRSKDLRKLFKAYMVRKEEESNRPVTYRYGRSQQYYNETFRGTETFHGVIFFYEWSDITRQPVRYFSLALFEKFLTESELALEAWQKDVMLNLQEVYITCKPGSKELIVRGSYEALKISIVRQPNQQLTIPFTPPTSGIDNIMRMSPMYREQYY